MEIDLGKLYSQIKEQLKIANIYQVPRITKVVINVGVGKNRDNKQFLEAVRADIAKVTGQKPYVRTARKAVAGFNVREGNIVGYVVTLRGKRMEDFVNRFVHVTLPRVRDFRGLSMSGLDQQGNLNVGVTEHLAFPEIHQDQTDVVFGMQVTFVTSTRDREVAETMFRQLSFPLRTAEQEADEA